MSDLTSTAPRTPGTSDHKRAGLMVHAFAAVSAVALIGMLTDIWQLVFLTIPVFAVVMMLQGALRQDGTWERSSTLAILGYCAGLAVLVIWLVVAAASDVRFWGLPASMAVIVYLIWPYTAAGAGLLYAFVFDRTLEEEVRAAPTPGT